MTFMRNPLYRDGDRISYESRVFDELRKSGINYRIAGILDITDRMMNDAFWISVYPGMTNEMLADNHK
jgi:hypothetical protein